MAEATNAAKRAVPRLRGCKDIPRSVTVDLDIVRGHGVVTGLDQHAPAPGDPRYPWHTCAVQKLAGVRYPDSVTPGRVQVRLTLR